MLFMLFGIFGAIDNFVNALYPTTYYPAPVDYYIKGESERPVPEEILEEQQRYYEEQKINEQRRNLAHGLGRLASVAFVALPVFIFHWRQTRPDD